jgi:hypothetical protein
LGAACRFARFVGSPALTFLDGWALADATDDLVLADDHPPRLRSWDDSERINGNEGPRGGTPAAARPSRAVQRSGRHSEVHLQAAPGSYAAAYLFAENGLGVTVRIHPSGGDTALIRITRTR